jgi:hypothetical protein
MYLCEGPSSINIVDDVGFDVKLVDNGQRDNISFVVMGMDIDEDNKNVEAILWALMTLV